jgi:glycosyltransferase involved in cell wall biosynthesis
MTDIKLSVIIPTCGRETLVRTLQSLIPAGLRSYDEVLVVGDGSQPAVGPIVLRFHPLLDLRYFEHGPTRMVGHAQRQYGMSQATGTHLLSIDDDDVYLPGAISAVHEAIRKNPDRVLLFREESRTPRHPWGIIWKDRQIRQGNVGTRCVVAPNVHGRLGTWGNRYEGDYDFIRSTVDLYPDRDAGVVWVDRVIAYLY